MATKYYAIGEYKELGMKEKNIFNLSGKVALITAGGRELGRAFCESLAEFGADIACFDVDEQNLKNGAAALERFRRRTAFIQADISKPDDVTRMVHDTVSSLGAIDILVNNAGITDFPTRISDTPKEQWDRMRRALSPVGSLFKTADSWRKFD